MNKIQYIAFILFILVLIVVLKKYYDSKKESSSYSPVEYANYPNLTGNPVADIAILNQAGFRYDH